MRQYQTGGEMYGYGSDNRRLWKYKPGVGHEVTFWAGGRLATYNLVWAVSPGWYFTEKTRNVRFGGKLVRTGAVSAQATVITDRLGSVRVSKVGSAVERLDYWPYGEEKPSVTGQEREKFATYTRDSTGLDYADQRYYGSTGLGWFLTADPYEASGGVIYPASWNRYSYVTGDPVNKWDGFGLQECWIDDSGQYGCGGTPSISSYTTTVSTAYEDNLQYYQGLAAISHAQNFTVTIRSDPWLGRQNADPGVRADALREEIRDGNLTECEGLTAFATQTATSMNVQGNNLTSHFVQEFGTLIPSSHPAVIAANVAGVPIASAPAGSGLGNTGQPGGFRPEYQELLQPNEDQSHHFAAYFQMGYFAGHSTATAAGVLSDLPNPGDIALAQAAARIGSRLRDGHLTMHSVAGEIRRLCQ